MIKVGLTGNYGMGKSTVAKYFSKLGAYVIDTDALVSELLEKKEVVEEVRKLLGDDVVTDGKLDKKKIAKIVFKNPFMRIYLENILHPLVFRRIEEIIEGINTRGEPKIVVIEAPVIFERGYQNRFDIIVTVFCTEEQAIERLKKKGVKEEDAKERLNSQFPIEMKKKNSDYLIDNSGSLEDTYLQVEAVFQKLVAMERKYAGN